VCERESEEEALAKGEGEEEEAAGREICNGFFGDIRRLASKMKPRRQYWRRQPEANENG